MSFYSNQQLTDYSMSQEAGTKCVGYGSGASHEGIYMGAGGGYDDFKDPRPNQEGKIRMDRFFVNEKNNEIVGMNFTKNGEFCCSYKGDSYNDILDKNREDYSEKKRESSMSEEYASAEKGFNDAYAKGDMKAAKEYQEQMDRARLDAKEKDIQNEQQKATSEVRSRN